MRYRSFDLAQITVESKETLTFPAVTICNMNGVMRSAVVCPKNGNDDELTSVENAQNAFRLVEPDVQPSFHTADAIAASELVERLFAHATVSERIAHAISCENLSLSLAPRGGEVARATPSYCAALAH